jgi:hypothetical protein
MPYSRVPDALCRAALQDSSPASSDVLIHLLQSNHARLSMLCLENIHDWLDGASNRQLDFEVLYLIITELLDAQNADVNPSRF